MSRDRLSAIAHAHHPVAAPFADATVDALVRRVAEAQPQRVLDVGCGSGQWLMRLLVAAREARGVGVDLSAEAIQAASAYAVERRVGDRVELRRADAATVRDSADRFDALLCIGSTHALGGLVPTMQALRAVAAPGAVALVGDGFWEQPPGTQALAALDATPDEFPSYAGLVAAVESCGWTVEHVQVSTLTEWDDYEWSWVSTLRRWAREHPDDPDAGVALQLAQDHAGRWLDGYRATLGFAAVTAVAA